jgi:beta-lactam-binding protein with PASTA domain
MNFEQLISLVKKIYHFIVQRIFLRNIVLAFLIVVLGTIVIMFILKLYTRHGEELSVPDMRGLTLSEAVSIATEKELHVVVFDSVFLTDYEPGTVVDQHPKTGFKVKRNRKVFLTMNAMNPELVALPNLIDLTFRQATAKLKSFGLNVGEVTYEPDIGINMVLKQKLRGKEIAPGDSVSKGSSIDLILGKGLSDEVSTVPNLVGLKLDAAKVKAADRFFRIGGVLNDNTILPEEDKEFAWIYQQRPEAGPGVMLPLGSSIDVWITVDSTKVPVSDTIITNADEEGRLDF